MRTLACWLVKHRWKTVIEEAERYRACSACGKVPHRGGPTPITATVEYMKGSAQSDSPISSSF